MKPTPEEIILKLKRRLIGDFVDVRVGMAGEVRDAIAVIENQVMANKELLQSQVRLLQELDELKKLVGAGVVTEDGEIL